MAVCDRGGSVCCLWVLQISWDDGRAVFVGSNQIRTSVSEKKLVFQSEDLYHSCMQETISLGEKNQKDGAEILKERERKAEVKQGKKQKGRSDALD